MAEDYTNVLASFKPIDHYTTSGYMRTPVYGNQIDIAIKTEDWTNTSTHTIIDVLADSESGYGSKYLPGEPSKQDFVVMDVDYVHDCLNTTKVTKFIIHLEDGANVTSVMSELWNLAPHSFSKLDSPYIHIDEALESKGGQSIYGVYTLNVIFSTIYLTVGMLIVSSVRVRNMRKQFSVLRALGTNSNSIIVSVLIDSALGLLLALGIGSLLGLILSGFALSMPLVYTGLSTLQLWSRLPVILVIPFEIIGGIIATSFLFSFIATYVVTRRALQRNIAEEIQYLE